MWFLHSDFSRMVSDSWNAPAHGSPDFIFPFNLKRLKVAMKDWNLRVFGNINSRLKQDQLRFEMAARNSDEDPSDTAKLNVMKDVMAILSETRFQQSTMLKQKSRIQWLVEGSNYNQLRDHVVHYYEDKFNGQETQLEEDLFNFDHPSISIEKSHAMGNIPSLEEIKQVVFELGADSAPGPDGFSRCFYRHCWDIIHEDLILVTRLSNVLDKLVYEEQVAFMKGRNIHENISLASEMVNELHIKRKDGNIGLKLDISQDFDTVSWNFVLEVFRRYGFSEKWCAWLLDIFSYARIYVLLNGNPEGYFKITRGLRQGDPLSPLIFVLIEDVLSRNITKIFNEKKMTPMVTRNGLSPTHLFFVDDIMIFFKEILKAFIIWWIYWCERAIRNFIWPGDANVSLVVVVAFDKVCCPFEEGV
ncbi:uncharacterized protein LOC113342241 [Papaver somniferum]|uniref:uncharacterized protein LOC113342241 n=1 Tax=Papaver somniferum TaxID=3469 RepID=UPI000E6F9C70|nr:uncharacterized protein LOC113342241 [Papaver somniferum]